MPTQTITEKGKFIETFEREYQTTLKLLRLYPADQLDLKPSPRSNVARDIIWVLALGHMALGIVIEKNELMPGEMPKAPATMPEILAAMEAAHRDTAAKLQKLTDEQMNASIRIPVGPKQIGDVRRGDALWMFLYDGIHHRGQVTVYQRIAGGKVPSIYGPSGDEPWM